MLAVIVVLVIILAVMGLSIRVVSQSNLYVIEFLGKYRRTLDAGLHFLVPFVESVAKKVTIKEQVLDFPPQPVITKDNVTMKIDTVVYFFITDAKLYTYGVVNPVTAIENLTATTLRNIMGDLELDQALTSRDTINSKMREILDEATDPWGIKINRVELKNIIPPAEIQVSMEKQMKAERDRRETLLEAEGHKQAVVTREEGNKRAKILAAEGEREANIARAEGEAKAIELVAAANVKAIKMIKDEAGLEGLLVLKKLESLEKVADGNATKLILPTELSQSAQSLTMFGELAGLKPEGAEKPAPKTAPITDECCD